MVKQSELEIMVCDLFVDAYRAGASGGDGNYGVARVSRAKLIEKIGDLYKEIDDLKQELEDERHAYSYLLAMYEELKVMQENPNELTDSRLDPADYADLPFPDVEELADAGEVEGADE